MKKGALFYSCQEDEFYEFDSFGYKDGLQVKLSSALNNEFWDQEKTIGEELPPRCKHVSCVINDKTIVVFGGESELKENNSIYLLEPKQERLLKSPSMVKHGIWKVSKKEILSEEKPPTLKGHTAINFLNNIYIFGGQVWESTSTMWVLYTDVWEWKIMNHFSNKSPVERHFHSATVIKNQMIIYGGISTNKLKKRILGDCWKFNLETYEWNPVERNGLSPKERHSHSSCTYLDRFMIIFGGLAEEKKCFLQDLWIFDSTTDIWTEIFLTGNIPCPRGGHSMSNIGNSFLLIHQGFDAKKTLSDCFIIDLKTNKSQILLFDTRMLKPSNRKYSTSFIFNSNFYLIGGKDSKKNLNDVWVLDTEELKLKYLLRNASKEMSILEIIEKNPKNKKEKKQYNAEKIKLKSNKVKITSLPKITSDQSSRSSPKKSDDSKSPKLMSPRSQEKISIDLNVTIEKEDLSSVETPKLEIQKEMSNLSLNSIQEPVQRGRRNSRKETEEPEKDEREFPWLPEFPEWKKYIFYDTKSEDVSQRELAQKEISHMYNVEKNTFEMLAICYFESRQYQKSIPYLTHCIEQKIGESLEMIKKRGTCYFMIGDFKKAIIDFVSIEKTLDVECTALRGTCLLRMEKVADAVDVLEVCMNSNETEEFISPFYYHSAKMKEELKDAKSVTSRRVTYDHSLDGQHKNFNFFLIGHEGVGISTFLTKLAFLYKGLLPPRDCLQYSTEIQKELFKNVQIIVKSGKFDIKMTSDLPQTFTTKSFPLLLNLLSENDFETISKAFSVNDELSANYKYLFKHYERILKENYLPIPKDIQSSEISVTKLKMIKFVIENVPFIFKSHSIDERIETKKSERNMIVLMVSLSDYDIILDEPTDEFKVLSKFFKINKKSSCSILKSLKLFHEFCCNDDNKNHHVILLYNKCDIFEKKMTSGSFINKVFPEYESGKDYRKTKEYLMACFETISHKFSKKREIFAFYLSSNKVDSVNTSIKNIYNHFQSLNATAQMSGDNII
eukprot:gene6117-10124_t